MGKTLTPDPSPKGRLASAGNPLQHPLREQHFFCSLLPFGEKGRG